MLDGEEYARMRALADRFLPEDVRGRWLALLRPAVRLDTVAQGQPWDVRLGGLPRLPADLAWPWWPGHGPLSFIGEIDCSSMGRFGLPLNLPAAGRLLFFYFDGQFDGYKSFLYVDEPSSRPGAQTLFIPAGAVSQARSAPDGLTPFGQAFLTGEPIVTSPGPDHPVADAEFRQPGETYRSYLDHPIRQDEFLKAVDQERTAPRHQVGGYPYPVQNAVEHEVTRAVLGGVSSDDERFVAEAARWALLLQVDTDDDLGMMWGDCGSLYWLVRPADLARQDLTEVQFTWQCC